MKYIVCSIPLLFLLPASLASDALLRGNTRKLTGKDFDFGPQPDNGCFEFDDGCPDNHYTTEECYPDHQCSSNKDCESECGDIEGCCCVNTFFSWCGVPETCSPYGLACMPETTPTPSPTEDGRGNEPDGTIGGADVYFCDSFTTQEVWCEELNLCTSNSTCSVVMTDPATGSVNNTEEFCTIRNACVLQNGTFGCPSDAGTIPCGNMQLVPIGVTNSDGEVWTYHDGRIQYDDLTHVAYTVHELNENNNRGPAITYFDVSLTYEEWQLPLANGVACPPLYEIDIYVQLSGRNVLQMCYDSRLSSIPGLTPQQALPIPACSDVNFGKVLPRNGNYYVARFLAVPGRAGVN